MANLPGGTRPDMARAERIEAQLPLPALFWRRIKVVKLTLVGPNILFEQVGGKPNRVFSPPTQAGGATLSTHLMNGRVPGNLPVIGATQLHFEDADLRDRIGDLRLGVVDVSLAAAGGLATLAGAGQFAGQPFKVRGTLGVPTHLDERVSVPMSLETRAASNGAKDKQGSLALKG